MASARRFRDGDCGCRFLVFRRLGFDAVRMKLLLVCRAFGDVTLMGIGCCWCLTTSRAYRASPSTVSASFDRHVLPRCSRGFSFSSWSCWDVSRSRSKGSVETDS